LAEGKWINREARLHAMFGKEFKFMTLVFVGKWIKKEKKA